MGTVVDSSWKGKMGVTVVASEKWIPSAQTAEDSENGQEQDASTDAGEEENSDDRIDTRKTAAAARGTKSGKKKKAEKMQAKLTLKAAGMDRFKGAAPSILDGEDWDIPTYVRRGVKLGK